MLTTKPRTKAELMKAIGQTSPTCIEVYELHGNDDIAVLEKAASRLSHGGAAKSVSAVLIVEPAKKK